MAGSSIEAKQDLDDSLCEEDFSQTQMPQEPLKLHNISNNNNNDTKYGSTSCSEEENLQIFIAPDDSCNNSTPVQLHDDNASTQRSPSILVNPQPPPRVINTQKRKPIFGKKNTRSSPTKDLVTKKRPVAADNNDNNNLSPKPSKGSTSDGDKSEEKSTPKDASSKSAKEPTSGGDKLKGKNTPKNASEKVTPTKSAEEKKNGDVDKPKKRASLKASRVSFTAEEKAVKCEQKKEEKEAKNRDKEQKKIERERKREENERLKVENERLKAEKTLKSLLLKEERNQKKAGLEHKKREEKLSSKGQINIDEQNKMKRTFIAQRAKEGQGKASAQKKMSVQQRDALEIDPISIREEDDMSSMHDLQSQNPAEVAATNISSHDSPSPPSSSSILFEDIGSPTHNTHLEFKNPVVTCKDTVSHVVRNPKQPLPEDSLSAAPEPKRAKLDSNVIANFAYQKKSLKTGSELKNGSVCPDLKERNKTTKLSASTRTLQKKPQTKICVKANMTGPVWVKCCNKSCQKWRQLKDHFDPLTVPIFWKCTDNSDKDCNDCSIPMEQWDDYENDDFQFVESAYVPGSLVWAKLGSYPWWPAIVEADPDDECYYEMGPINSLVPVKYHVVFFDTPVSRSWLQAKSIVPFADVTDANKEHKYRGSKKYKKNLAEGVKQAKDALKIDVKERLDVYGFSKCHATHRKKAATLKMKKRPNMKYKWSTTNTKITKRKLKGKEREEMGKKVMKVAKKRELKEEQESGIEEEQESGIEKEEMEIAEEEARMEWENGEQGPGLALLQPED